VATVIKSLPLRRISLQPLSISCEILELEISYTAFNPSADLAAHLAVARPAQIEVRQSPLKEGNAIGVLHLAFCNFGWHLGLELSLHRRHF
jgi:hypothetical protein